MLGLRDQHDSRLPQCAAADRVIARNRHIADGATEVWTYAAQMIADAIKDGHLPK